MLLFLLMKSILVKPVTYTMALMFPALASVGCSNSSRGQINDAADSLISADANHDGTLSRTEAANDIIKRYLTGQCGHKDPVYGLTPEILKKAKKDATIAQGVVPAHARTYLEVLAQFEQIYSDSLEAKKTE